METANKLTYLSTKFFTENKEEYRITVTVSLMMIVITICVTGA